jgi:hypothetical protein
MDNLGTPNSKLLFIAGELYNNLTINSLERSMLKSKK